jgi:serine/threonine protein phosphatase PrpC/ribosomal protein L32
MTASGQPSGPPAEAAVAVCPACGEPSLPGETFCESCGASLAGAGTDGVGAAAGPAAGAAPANGTGAVASAGTAFKQTDEPSAAAHLSAPRSSECAQCGGAIAADGYCSECGAPAAKVRDHWEERPAAWLGGVTDRGVRHHRNEDAMALAAGSQPGGLGVLVVCDGVSSSADSDIASLAAARAAREVLASPQSDGGSVAGRIHGWTRRLAAAAEAANEQAVRVSRSRPADAYLSGGPSSPPSCTFVAAVVDGPLVVTGWVGDSRAYWLPDGGEPRQLSEDDSWAAEQIALGMPREEAEAAPMAHAITRWLGVDSTHHEPRCLALTPESPGWLMLCSDGLWNYASTAEAVAGLVADTTARVGGDPTTIAGELVTWANEQGGHDNITVALARLPGSPG